MKKLLLIDGSSLLHRAFYALPLLSNAEGVYTNAVHGFMVMFNKIVKDEKPHYAAVCFDKSRVTFRTAIAADYKGTRKETPPELRGQFQLIQQVLELAGVHTLELDGFEADDIIGSLARCGAEAGFAVEIFTGDRDAFQLIDEQVRVHMTKKGISEVEIYDTEAIIEKYGVSPRALIEVKALMGDTSDNISGVPGVGEKTALKLIADYGDIDNLYAHIDEQKGKLKEKLIDGKDKAYTSRILATIRRDIFDGACPDWQTYALTGGDVEALRLLYTQLGLRQLLRALPEEAPAAPVAEAAPAAACASLDEVLAEAGPLAVLPLYEGAARGGSLQQAALARGEKCCLVGAAEALPLLSDFALPKIVWCSKELQLLLMSAGVEMQGVVDDPQLAAYLLDAGASSYEPAELLARYLMLNVTADDAAAIAKLTLPLMRELNARLEQQQLSSLYRDVELPLAAVLARMEAAGVAVERAGIAAMSQRLGEELAQIQQSIYDLAGHSFNINSPKQLGQVLFEEQGIPPVKKSKSGYSTDAEVLEQLADAYPLAQLILDYRAVAKLKSTYADGILQALDADTDKLHCVFNQTVTATGRLSSAEPNLQNIPVRSEAGRQIRRYFKPERAGDLLLAGDYNQIELRVLAHICADERLKEAFIKGEDIHARTASEVLDVPMAEVTADQRRQAKAVNFGIVYGISDFGLAKDLGISRAAAHDYIDRYFLRYPGVERYQQKTIAECADCGFVTTLLGRRRYLPDINASNFNRRSFAQRMAINTPIQGSAADIIKIAMIRIDAELRRQNLRSRLILQIHDELIIDMAAEEAHIVPQLLKRIMEEALPLDVPLLVDIKQGENWYEMKKIQE
ncbi:MAG: DNA polymerase I [Firmicutes bacterium]|nr:DNA polymerase I [Bacillota bacterium]